MGVAEHDGVRPFARNLELEIFLQRVRVHDVVNEKFALGERNHLGDPEGGRTIRVAEHGCDRGNRFQFNDDGIAAHVARVQDVTDAGENFRDFRVEQTVRVGNKANLHKSDR